MALHTPSGRAGAEDYSVYLTLMGRMGESTGYPATGVAVAGAAQVDGSIEYQAAQQLYVGGLVGIDNARDYRQWYAGIYVRYALQRQTGLIAFPPVPPQSAVGPLPF